MHRLRRGASAFGGFSVPLLKKKALNSWSAVQETFFSTKDIFERHRVVFTVGTSVASLATAWAGLVRMVQLYEALLKFAGYSIRHYHESKVDQRLESIERAMKNDFRIEHDEIKKIVHRDSSNTAACIASAGTTLIFGYALGWRGGRWYATRKFRRDQMKQLGHTIPSRWQMLSRIKPRGGLKLQFLKRSSARSLESAKPCQDAAVEAPGSVARAA